MEIMFDIAVTHPQEADVLVGMWPPTLRQILRLRFQTAATTPMHEKLIRESADLLQKIIKRSIQDTS